MGLDVAQLGIYWAQPSITSLALGPSILCGPICSALSPSTRDQYFLQFLFRSPVVLLTSQAGPPPLPPFRYPYLPA